MKYTQILEESAGNYDCPTVNRKCRGTSCMAWVGGKLYKVTPNKGLVPTQFVPENWLQKKVGGNPIDWTWELVNIGRCGMVPR
jgi:hypothetical protein